MRTRFIIVFLSALFLFVLCAAGYHFNKPVIIMETIRCTIAENALNRTASKQRGDIERKIFRGYSARPAKDAYEKERERFVIGYLNESKKDKYEFVIYLWRGSTMFEVVYDSKGKAVYTWDICESM